MSAKGRSATTINTGKRLALLKYDEACMGDGLSASLMAALHQALPQAAVTNAYGTTEAGPVVFGPHPRGLPQPEP